MKRLDLCGDVEAHQRESLRAPGLAVRDGVQVADGESGASDFSGGQTEEGRQGGGGGGGSRVNPAVVRGTHRSLVLMFCGASHG